jgi:hypothetical protein
MKNSPFRKTFIGGLVVLFFLILFLLVVFVNVYNGVNDYLDSKERNKPKVREIIIEEIKPEVNHIEEIKPEVNHIDTPKIKVINKPKEKVIDTPIITKPKDTVVVIDTTILKK